MSEPMSNRSLTAAVCPFIAANIRGEMPNLLPVLEIGSMGRTKGKIYIVNVPEKLDDNIEFLFQDLFRILYFAGLF